MEVSFLATRKALQRSHIAKVGRFELARQGPRSSWTEVGDIHGTARTVARTAGTGVRAFGRHLGLHRVTFAWWLLRT